MEENRDDPPQSPGEVFHAEYSEEESPSIAVLLAISAVEGVEPTKMEPLYESVAPNALDALLDGPIVIGDSGTMGVEFQYSGYQVSVRNNGSITLREEG